MQSTGAAVASSLTEELPHSEESERAILGSILLYPSLITEASELLRDDDFYIPQHRQVFAAMKTMAKRGSELQAVLIHNELKKDGPPTPEASFIVNLSYGIPHSTTIR